MMIVATIAGYLVCIGATFQFAEPLSGGHDNTFRGFAACFWPVTACVAAGSAIARLFQATPSTIRRLAARRRERLPLAVASDEAAWRRDHNIRGGR
jgi:hypothetical protein